MGGSAEGATCNDQQHLPSSDPSERTYICRSLSCEVLVLTGCRPVGTSAVCLLTACNLAPDSTYDIGGFTQLHKIKAGKVTGTP
jgi:hypothetical protein